MLDRNKQILLNFFSFNRSMIHYESAFDLMDPRVREVLFLLAVSNSCMNPIIYGHHVHSYLAALQNCWHFIDDCVCNRCNQCVPERQQESGFEMSNLNIRGDNIDRQGQNDQPVLAATQEPPKIIITTCETAV